MPAPFKDHPSDNQVLSRNTLPMSRCPKHLVQRGEGWIEVTDVPILTGECLWHIYQDEAEEIVAPRGVLIADPVARNRAINAAYARLWLTDPRFQWAGLAAFASKQVGCGMLHATNLMDLIEQERNAKSYLARLTSAFKPAPGNTIDDTELEAAKARFAQAAAANPVDYDLDWANQLSSAQQALHYVNTMMALGNTALFLDIYPLHAFYAKRGIEEFRKCLDMRAGIFGHWEFPILWPVKQDVLRFGHWQAEILKGFEAIEAGDIVTSVEQLAIHEQKNILQPSMYSNRQLVRLLRLNHASFVMNFPSGVSQAIELTLSNQCQPLDDGRTISFSDSIVADLSDLDQRMPFVFRAATQFDSMLKDHRRPQIEQSIRDIAGGTV